MSWLRVKSFASVTAVAVAVDVVVVAGNAVLVDNAVDHHDCSSSSSHHLYHYNAD